MARFTRAASALDVVWGLSNVCACRVLEVINLGALCDRDVGHVREPFGASML